MTGNTGCNHSHSQLGPCNTSWPCVSRHQAGDQPGLLPDLPLTNHPLELCRPATRANCTSGRIAWVHNHYVTEGVDLTSDSVVSQKLLVSTGVLSLVYIIL